jgi:hypothetical protein
MPVCYLACIINYKQRSKPLKEIISLLLKENAELQKENQTLKQK